VSSRHRRCRDVAFRPRQIGHKASRDGITDAERHNGGNAGGLGRDRRRIAKDHDGIDLGLQLIHQLRKLHRLPRRPARFLEGQILSKRIAKRGEAGEQQFRVGRGWRQRPARTDEGDAKDLGRLRSDRAGRGERGGAKKDYELAPFHECLRVMW
jgi:hypothetical protein